jgi:hypothetical protein
MAFNNPSNQLIQIDSGNALTYLYNSSQAVSIYAGLGENQVLGQRYVATVNATATNPSGSPAYYMLVKYLSTSATTTANLTTAGGPAPVWWTDNTFTTVSGISTEALGGTTLGLNFPAGYMTLNIISLTTLTNTLLLGAQVLIQVGGYLKGAFAPGTGTAGIGNWIVPAAGTFTSTGVVAGTTAPTLTPFGRQMTVIASGLCDVLVGTDNF